MTDHDPTDVPDELMGYLEAKGDDPGWTHIHDPRYMAAEEDDDDLDEDEEAQLDDTHARLWPS